MLGTVGGGRRVKKKEHCSTGLPRKRDETASSGKGNTGNGKGGASPDRKRSHPFQSPSQSGAAISLQSTQGAREKKVEKNMNSLPSPAGRPEANYFTTLFQRGEIRKKKKGV